MSFRLRKCVIVSAITVTLLIANTSAIACWLEAIGAVAYARGIRQEYLTGTAIVVILAMVFLNFGGMSRPWRCFHRRCSVCRELAAKPSRYCPQCGSRITRPHPR